MSQDNNIYLKMLSSWKDRLDKKRRFKRLFKSEDGSKVLQDILFSARVGRPITDNFQMGAYNLGISILREACSSDKEIVEKIKQLTEAKVHYNEMERTNTE